MFGGLEVKQKKKEEKEEAAATAAAAAPAGKTATAFSFMNAMASAPTTETSQQGKSIPSPSAFSFLGAMDGASASNPVTLTSSVAAGNQDAATESAALSNGHGESAFGFLSGDSKTDAPSTGGGKVDPKKVEASDVAPPVASSSFSFLQQTKTNAPASATIRSEIPEPEGLSLRGNATATSGFSFTSDSGAVSTVTAGEAIPAPASSAPSPASETLTSSATIPAQTLAPAAAATDFLGTSNVNPTAPTGSGVVFGGGGGALAAAKKPKKKRNRTAKIGVAANTNSNITNGNTSGLGQLPAPVAAAPPRTNNKNSDNLPPGSTKNSAAATAAGAADDSGGGNGLRDAALDAARRTEKMLKEKTQEASNTTDDDVISSSSSAFKFVRDDSSQDLQATESEDDIIAAAKAAAQEAKQMQKRSNSGRMGGFGSLFRSRASPPPVSNGSGSNNISTPNPNAVQTAIIPSSSTSNVDQGTASTVSPADGLRKEQEDIQRDMADRQMQMIKAQQAENEVSTDADPASISRTSASLEVHGAAQPVATLSVQPVKSEGSGVIGSSAPVNCFKYESSTVSGFPGPSSSFSATGAAPSQASQISTVKPPNDMMHDIIAEFRSQVVLSMENVKQLRQHRSHLLEERFVVAGKERMAIQQKAAAETQQMEAAEREDFELADRLGSVIDGHHKELSEYTSILENIGRALDQLDAQKEAAVASVKKCFSDVQGKLRKLEEEQVSKDTEDSSDALLRFSVVSKQLSAEYERLMQDQKHLERDAGLISAERKELEDVISEQAGEFEALRDGARERLADAEKEIEELRKKLAAKQAEAAQLRTEAAGHDEAILRVRVKFSRQLTRLQKKETTIRDNQEEWDLEKRSYEASKEEHDAQVAAHSESLLARENLLESLKVEIDMADTFESIVSKEIGFDVTNHQSEDKLDEETAQLQADLIQCEAESTELKDSFKAAACVLSKLEEEISSLECRIPQLEEIKKSAASRRDFKGAGKASKEIKEAESRLKHCKEDLLHEALARKAGAEEASLRHEDELAVKRSAAHEKEKENGIAMMKLLSDKIKRLLVTKGNVCGDALDNSIQGVGAYVLDGQIAALTIEGATYGDKFGGWDELMSEIGLSDTSLPPENSVKDDSEIGDKTLDKIKAPEPLTQESDPCPPSDDETRANEIQRFRLLTLELKDIEGTLAEAVENEDYEAAAELDEKQQAILAQVEALNLTDEEMLAGLADPPPSGDDSAIPPDMLANDSSSAGNDPEPGTSPGHDDVAAESPILEEVGAEEGFSEGLPEDEEKVTNGNEKDTPIAKDEKDTSDELDNADKDPSPTMI